MVPRYISKVFKDETGEGLLDHINRLRIQQAKKIMQNKNLVLEDVAGQGGFTNVNSFISGTDKTYFPSVSVTVPSEVP